MSDYIKNIIEDMKRTHPYENEDSLSVEEVLKMPAFEGYKLLAGGSGLKKRCRHITILETPTGISWLEGDEFLLTAGYAFVNNEEFKKNMLLEAHEKGVSAIAIKDKRYFGEIPNELIEQANEFEIPIILIPYSVVYTSTISSFYNMIFYRKNEYILNLNNIYEKLLGLSFENKNIEEIINSLSSLSNSNVFLFNTSFKLLSSSIVDKNNFEKINDCIPFKKDGKKLLIDLKKHSINMNINNSYITIYPVKSENKVIAYLLVSSDMIIDRLSQNSIEYGVSIISMKLEMGNWNKTVRNRVNKSLVEIMLNKKDLPEDFYQNIEIDLGWNTEEPIVGLCISLHIAEEEIVEEYMQNIYDYFNNIFEDGSYLSINRNNDIFIFSRFESNIILEDFVSSLYNYLKPFNDDFRVSIGVSTPYKDIKNIAQLRDESYLASLFTKRGIIYYKSLDTIKLLYPLKDDEEIQEYYSRTIKKLEDYDEINNSNLIKTLETYFRYNLRKSVVSEKLFIHVETLRYRLNKIEEITGYSINDSEGLFALQMGVKLRSLLKLR